MGDQRRYNTHAASAAHSAIRSMETVTTTRAERRCCSETGPGGEEGGLGGGTDACGCGSGRTPADGKIDPLPRARAGMTALASTCGYGPLELESAA